MYKFYKNINIESCKEILQIANSLDDWKVSKGPVMDYATRQNMVKLLTGVDGLKELWPVSDWYKAMFLKIPAGGIVARHSDGGGEDQDVKGPHTRYHLPIQTNDKCVSKYWDGEKCNEHHLKLGEVWSMDPMPEHESTNGGNLDRIHLIMEIYD